VGKAHAASKRDEIWSAPAERSGDGALDQDRRWQMGVGRWHAQSIFHLRSPIFPRREWKAAWRFASRRTPKAAAFTLIGLLAALAVIAVLVAAMVPTIIRRVDRAAWTAETANLSAIADSFTQYILRSKIVPGTNDWATAIANQMSQPVSAITTNSRRFARAFLVDPSFQIGTNVAGQPYTQTTNGTAKPNSARLMIVSSLARALPTNIVTSVPSSNEFNAIWNTTEGAKPTTWTNWAGSGDDLRIKKLNLEPLFHQLILVNHSQSTNAVGRFSIDGSPTVNVPTNSPLGWKNGNVYYLDGTVVGLHYPTNSVVPTSVVQTEFPLKRNTSFLFESDAWRGQVQGDQQSYSASGADFFNHAVTFFNHTTNPSAASGGSQYGVMISMYTFMFDYTYWANECPHFNNHGLSPSATPEYSLLSNQADNNKNIDQFSTELIKHP
jgi:type II secretory pathway pseudopilin PulG